MPTSIEHSSRQNRRIYWRDVLCVVQIKVVFFFAAPIGAGLRLIRKLR